MHKILIVAVGALALAGCNSRTNQVLAAGTVGAVAGTIIGSELAQPRPVVVERQYPQYYAPVPPRRPTCFSTWDRTPRGLVERRVCDRY